MGTTPAAAPAIWCGRGPTRGSGSTRRFASSSRGCWSARCVGSEAARSCGLARVTARRFKTSFYRATRCSGGRSRRTGAAGVTCRWSWRAQRTRISPCTTSVARMKRPPGCRAGPETKVPANTQKRPSTMRPARPLSIPSGPRSARARRRKGPVRVSLPLRALALIAFATFVVAFNAIATPSNAAAQPQKVCGPAGAAMARCHALLSMNGVGTFATSSPTGLSPATIKSAYNFSTSLTAGAGQTIAIVDAFDDPTAESDLAVFSGQFGLPACTTANGCFSKVNQTGGTNYPRKDAGGALEISLDIQWAHAIAPGAHILLVEATTNSFANLLTAEDYAKTHAQYVSNSWGASEFSGENSYDSHFAQSGVSFFVSSGDAGLPAEYPSSSPNVISVGGTTLHFSGSTFTGATGWSGGGSGCRHYGTPTSTSG